MSRWTISNLATMSPQEIFELVGFHILANNGHVRDVLLKPDARAFPAAKRNWRYLVWRRHAPKHCNQLIADLDRIARMHPARHAEELIACAAKHGVTI